MDPITIAIIILTTAAVIACWPYIVNLFSQTIIPFVRERISPTVADYIADIISFADGKLVPIRQQLKKAWRVFNETLLGCKTIYEKQGPNKLKAVTKFVTRNDNGKIEMSQFEEIVEWDDLPESIRSEITKQNKDGGELDVRKAVQTKVREIAETNKLLEVLEN